MAAERKKSETLTLRLDPKTRFMIDFIARLRGQSITTVLERAIFEAADHAKIWIDHNEQRSWSDLWDASEGVRELKKYAEPELFPTYEEESILSFCRHHRPFFYLSDKYHAHLTHYIEILWPNIKIYLDIWNTTKSNDYFAAGRAMQEAIRNAGVSPPKWPEPMPQGSKDDDDEIPF